MTIQNLDPELAHALGLNESQGVWLSDVTPGPSDDAASGESAPTTAPGAVAGLVLGPLDETARARLQVPASVKAGTVVNAVQPGSAASEAGLRPGEVIVEAELRVSGPLPNDVARAEAHHRREARSEAGGLRVVGTLVGAACLLAIVYPLGVKVLLPPYLRGAAARAGLAGC